MLNENYAESNNNTQSHEQEEGGRVLRLFSHKVEMHEELKKLTEMRTMSVLDIVGKSHDFCIYKKKSMI